MRDLRRPIAAAAAALFIGGGATVGAAVAALPHPWTGGYVSEAGVSGFARSGAYHAGIWMVSAGLLLIALSLQATKAITALLVTAGALGFVSGSVSCSTGCPLPPYETTTWADLVHGGASILAVALVALAMLIATVHATAHATVETTGPAWPARFAFAVTAATLAALTFCLLAIGRSTATAVLERIALLLVLAWLVDYAVRAAATR